jgi:recombinational DNA repair protein (RecF pathway)
MVFEGIVIHKVPYKERDLIVKLILRSGALGSFYIYGGQGGGKHHKPTIFELGSMVRITIREQNKSKLEGLELMVASETQRLWEPDQLRHNIQAFYLVCLYFEVLQKFAVNFQLGFSDQNQSEHEGLFSVMSNALFYLNESLKSGNFQASQQLMFFMTKLLFHMGIMPETDLCSYCGNSLMDSKIVSFLPSDGHFACGNCVNAENDLGFLFRLKKGYQTKYQNYAELTGSNFQEADKLIQYFCHHFHLRAIELKSYDLLMRMS